MRQELDGLIALPDQAIEVLESKVSAELTSGRSGETDTPAGPSSDARAAAPSRAAPTAPDSPSPLAPIGLDGVGVTVCANSNIGNSAAEGTR